MPVQEKQTAYKLNPKAIVILVYWIWEAQAVIAVLYAGYLYGDPDAMWNECATAPDVDICFWYMVGMWISKWVFLIMIGIIGAVIIGMLLTGAALRLFDKVEDGTPGSFKLESPVSVRTFNNFMFKLLFVEIFTAPIGYYVYQTYNHS